MNLCIRTVFWTRKISLILALFPFSFGATALAQTTVCQSVLSYVVEKAENETQEVHFGELKAAAVSEEAAKTQLAAEILRTKTAAMQACKKEHENTAGCLQAKLLASDKALQVASFTARKILEEALVEDCKKQQGICKEAKATEVKCATVESTAAPDANGSEKSDKPAADAKKK